MQQIKQTNNYDRFVFNPSNRDVHPKRVEQLELSIGLFDFGNSYPIVVSPPNENNGEGPMIMTIFDGQHRYWARYNLSLPVFFVIDPDMTIDKVGRINSTQHGWMLGDYLQSFATETELNKGLHQYKIVTGYQARHDFKAGIALKILCGGRWGRVREDLVSGTLKVTTDLHEAENFARAVKDFGQYISYNKNDRFIVAFKKLWDSPEYEHRKMLSKLEYLSLKLNRQPNIKSYVQMFQDIYNHKNQNPIAVT